MNELSIRDGVDSDFFILRAMGRVAVTVAQFENHSVNPDNSGKVGLGVQLISRNILLNVYCVQTNVFSTGGRASASTADGRGEVQ